MLPDVTRSLSTSIPGSCQPASDILKIITPLLVAALASLFLGANMVEIQAIWRLQRRSERIRPSW
jgi:hypothetical protein